MSKVIELPMEATETASVWRLQKFGVVGSPEAEKYVYYREYNPDIIIMLGDCLSILPLLDKVDLVVTDPPYGIGDLWVGGKGHGWGKARQQGDERNEWDANSPSKDCFDLILSKAKDHIIWGGNYFPLPVSRGWLVWNKPERNFSLAEAELAWTSFDAVIRVFDHHRSDTGRQHPTQKPLILMKWAIQQCKYWDTPISILDPFLGSGTTLVACKELKRNGIGIEINEKYCQIAKTRLQNTQVPFL